MDPLTFIAEVLRAVAWPILVFLMVMVFRKDIRHLASSIRKVGVKGMEFEFARDLHRVSELGAPVLPRTAEGSMEGIQVSDLELASISPRAAILEAWKSVEEAAVERLRRHRMEPPTTSAELESKLATGTTVFHDPRQAEVFSELRKLRNVAVHGPDSALTVDDALEFSRLASKLAIHIRHGG